MFCIIVTKPLVKVNRTGTAADHAMLEPGDKWAEVQEHIISRAFSTKAECHCWAWKYGGIEEHDAGLVARGRMPEFNYFKQYGCFSLRETSHTRLKPTSRCWTWAHGSCQRNRLLPDNMRWNGNGNGNKRQPGIIRRRFNA